ncbi:lanthionine synthetase LanC family protein [Streptomyces hainanensis]|uniref:lanthionine synthetase LanC family protein n=1 Tax=Streptomyces hainanensis TaxID=402648 RepID=UPI001404A723|nr:lanthionine synthetase LanC family protein [Streptomyces hainanensis]
MLDDPRLARDAADWPLTRWAEGTEPAEAGWGKGAAGLLPASAEILTTVGEPDRLAGDRPRNLVDRATRLPDQGPVDLSVRHGSGGVVPSLIAAARLLDDTTLLARAHTYQERVLEIARTGGFFTGAPGRTSLLGYLLGWAGIGDSDVLLHMSAANGPFPIPVALHG